MRIVKDNKDVSPGMLWQDVSVLMAKSSRVIREEGWRNFVRKATVKIRGQQTRPHFRRGLAANVPYDVVLPVTTSFEILKQTVESVLSCTEGIAFHLLVLTDVSTDGQTRDYLDYLQRRLPHIVTRDSLQEKPLPQVSEIHSSQYLSFVQQINAGLSRTDRDVVLLYGAVTLTPRVLERLHETAYSDEKIASTIPLSGSLIPGNYRQSGFSGEPKPCGFVQDTAAKFDKKVLPAPTLLAPCMFIKKKVLAEVGGFDESFDAWYDAKNAFCMELRRRGYRVVVDLSTCVANATQATLQDELVQLQNNPDAPFCSKYPGYVSLVQDFVREDFLTTVRKRIGQGGLPETCRQSAHLRIGIDAQLLAHKWQVGTKRYVVELTKHLLRVDKRNRYILYTGGDILRDPDFGGYFKRFVINSADILLDSEGVDVFHRTNHAFSLCDVLVLLKAKASVVSIVDLILYHFPSYFSSQQEYHRYQQLMELSAILADRVIAISEHSRHDIIGTLGVDPEKVDVIHLGINDFVDKCSNKVGIQPRYTPRSEYILYTGSDFPHKNLEGLVFAFGRLVQKSLIHHDLLIVGPSFSSKVSKELHDILKGHDEKVVFLGYVSDQELLSLYRNASLYVFPSLYEGFGFPPLEAMACGVPVVASRATSIPEVVGDAALLADCEDVNDLAEKIDRGLHDKHLRQKLINAGFKRVQAFKWDDTATKTVEVYEKAYRDSLERHNKLTEDIKERIYDLVSKEGSKYGTLERAIQDVLDTS